MTTSNIKIEDIVAPIQGASDDPDEKTSREIESLDRAYREEELSSLKQDNKLRADFAQKLYKLVVWWLSAIGVCLGLEGFGSIWGFFNLGDSIVIALLGGTTLNVLGIFYIVANYFFPKDGVGRRVIDPPDRSLPIKKKKTSINHESV